MKRTCSGGTPRTEGLGAPADERARDGACMANGNEAPAHPITNPDVAQPTYESCAGAYDYHASCRDMRTTVHQAPAMTIYTVYIYIYISFVSALSSSCSSCSCLSAVPIGERACMEWNGPREIQEPARAHAWQAAVSSGSPKCPQLRLRGCRMAHGWLPSWPVTDTDRSVTTTTHAPEAQEGASLSHAIANTGVVVPLVHAAAGYLRVTRIELFI
jgi:hypothetical protein